MQQERRSSLLNLFFGFFPIRFESGNPQLDLEAFYNRF